jgi:MoxR-like ATPase
VRASALPALRHRILLNFEGEAEGIKTDQLIEAVIKTIPETKVGMKGDKDKAGANVGAV